MSCIFQPGPTPCTAARTQNVPEWSSSHRDWTTGLYSAPATHSESGGTAIYIKGLYNGSKPFPPPTMIFFPTSSNTPKLTIMHHFQLNFSPFVFTPLLTSIFLYHFSFLLFPSRFSVRTPTLFHGGGGGNYQNIHTSLQDNPTSTVSAFGKKLVVQRKKETLK
jgi:hypothetical protein